MKGIGYAAEGAFPRVRRPERESRAMRPGTRGWRSGATGVQSDALGARGESLIIVQGVAVTEGGALSLTRAPGVARSTPKGAQN